MLSLVAPVAALLAVFLVGRARAEVIFASDARWTLVGNTTTVRRRELSDFCPPPAGQENDVVILVNPEQFAGIEQATLGFSGAAVILYGAVLTGNPVEDQILTYLNGSARQLPAGWPDVIPQSSLDAKSGAACDIVLRTAPNLVPGPYTIGVSTVLPAQRIAIYNATIFASSILPTESQPTPSPTETADVRTDSSASLVSSAQSGARTQATTKEPNSGGLGASAIAAIVLPCVLIPILLGLLFLWILRRRRSRAGDSASNPSLQPFLESAQSPSSPGYPATEKQFSDAKSHDAMFTTSYTPSPGSSSLGTDGTPISRYGRGTNTSRAITEVPEDVATADPEQLIAIQRAVRQAGFSTQALLESLNRVRPATDDDSLTGPAPPHYDG